jgi:ADP-ribosyl-[dinitrogen reductase] hydrolase
MLVELAIGDAYGAGFEYAPEDLVHRRNTGTRYVRHPRYAIAPGCYTDDTQMSLALAEALVDNDPWTPQSLAERFVTVFRRDPREGYANHFYQLLKDTHNGAELLRRLQPASDRSGAAMRATPLGVLPTVAEVKERCRVQAVLTHNTPDGIHAAQAAALLTHHALYQRGPKSQLGQYLEGQVPGRWSEAWAGKVGAKGWMSVRAAITALRRNDRLSSLLRDCIGFTGDVDTVATIALAAASCSAEFEQDLPRNLLATLENGRYGRDYLAALDRKLLALKAG